MIVEKDGFVFEQTEPKRFWIKGEGELISDHPNRMLTEEEAIARIDEFHEWIDLGLLKRNKEDW